MDIDPQLNDYQNNVAGTTPTFDTPDLNFTSTFSAPIIPDSTNLNFLDLNTSNIPSSTLTSNVFNVQDPFLYNFNGSENNFLFNSEQISPWNERTLSSLLFEESPTNFNLQNEFPFDPLIGETISPSFEPREQNIFSNLVVDSQNSELPEVVDPLTGGRMITPISSRLNPIDINISPGVDPILNSNRLTLNSSQNAIPDPSIYREPIPNFGDETSLPPQTQPLVNQTDNNTLAPNSEPTNTTPSPVESSQTAPPPPPTNTVHFGINHMTPGKELPC